MAFDSRSASWPETIYRYALPWPPHAADVQEEVCTQPSCLLGGGLSKFRIQWIGGRASLRSFILVLSSAQMHFLLIPLANSSSKPQLKIISQAALPNSSDHHTEPLFNVM